MTLKKCGNRSTAPQNKPITVTQSPKRILLIGMQTTRSTAKLTKPPASRLHVETTTSPIWNSREKNEITIRPPVKVTAAGSDIRKTFFKKPLGIVSSWRSSASTKLGMPMDVAPIRLSWIGMKGYVFPIMIKSTHNNIEYNVLVKYNALTLSILDMIVLPSFTISFIEEKSESRSTI